MQVAPWGMLLGTAPVRERWQRDQREKLDRDAVATKASANPLGISGAGMALRNCLKEIRGQAFVSLTDQSRMWVTLSEAAPFSRRQFLEGVQI